MSNKEDLPINISSELLRILEGYAIQKELEIDEIIEASLVEFLLSRSSESIKEALKKLQYPGLEKLTH